MSDGGVLYKNFGDSYPPLIYFDFYWITRIFGNENIYGGTKITLFIVQSLTVYDLSFY